MKDFGGTGQLVALGSTDGTIGSRSQAIVEVDLDVPKAKLRGIVPSYASYSL